MRTEQSLFQHLTVVSILELAVDLVFFPCCTTGSYCQAFVLHWGEDYKHSHSVPFKLLSEAPSRSRDFIQTTKEGSACFEHW